MTIKRTLGILLSTPAVAGLATVALAVPTAVAAPAAAPRPTPWQQDLRPSAPTFVPPGQLKKATKATVQQTLDQAVRDGAIGVVARVDSPTFTGTWAAGKRELGGKAPATANAPFRVASNTKMMVATLVLQQIEAKRWKLQTTVDEISPGLLPGHGDVTLEQLLSHHSGIPDGVDAMLATRFGDGTTMQDFVEAAGADYSDQEIIDAANALPWRFPSGSQYEYSNTGYVVLGRLLEVATGRSVAQLLKHDVFGPAKMANSSFPTGPGLPGNALVDATNDGTGWYSLAGFNPELFSSSGAAVSTTKAMNDFTKSLVTGRLLSPELLAEMKRPRSGGPVPYGLGLFRVPDPCTPDGAPQQFLYGHNGATFGTLSVAYTSQDGRRQYTVGANGRFLTEDLTQPYDLDAVLMAMINASC